MMIINSTRNEEKINEGSQQNADIEILDRASPRQVQIEMPPVFAIDSEPSIPKSSKSDLKRMV